MGDGPGKMALRLGLTSELAVFRGVLVRDDEGVSQPALDCFVAALLFGSGLGAIGCFEGGARLLLIPSRPRFIMLAGVTGVSCVLKFGEGGGSRLVSCEVFDVEDDDDDIARLVGMGGAGGGMDRSTGEGVSPGASAKLPFRERVERRSGVELVDLEPRYSFLF